MSRYFAVAYYKIVEVPEPEKEMKRHKKFLASLDAKGRIYLSHEGINGQVSLSEESFSVYRDWMNESPIFKDCDFKLHKIPEHIFDRMTVKVKKQLVAVDRLIDFSKRAEHISPAEWKKTLDEDDENLLVIDVRNEYEGKVGHFKNSLIPPLETFREFPQYAKNLTNEYDPKKTKVLMCCTGGIRCEFFSPLMKEAGFENVYQLDGGIIGYGLKEGNKHWKGKLFVFDDRLVTPICEENKETISTCAHCSEKTDHYINCANMDCNKLFLSCDSCTEGKKGLCSEECKGGRVRPFKHKAYPKPFRRQTHEEKIALKSSSKTEQA